METITKLQRNGDVFVKIHKYNCDKCFIELCESDAKLDYYHNLTFCLDCSLKIGLIQDDYYLKMSGIFLKGYTEIKNDKINIYLGNKPDGDVRRDRKTGRYNLWRKNVLKRDNYTCRYCGDNKNKLIAHHIESYSLHKELRFCCENGLTLCVDCHKKEHKKR